MIDLIYDNMTNFDYHGLAIVKQNNMYGVIDINGNIILDITYKKIRLLDNGFVGIEATRDTVDYFDVSGEAVNDMNLLPRYTYPKVEKDLTIFSQDGKQGVINQNGEIIIEPIYDSITKNNSMYLVKLNQQYGVIDQDGRVLFEPLYEDIKVHYTLVSKEYLFSLKQNEKYGIFDQDGNVLADYQYSNLNTFDNQYSFVLGFLDKDKILVTKDNVDKIVNYKTNTIIVDNIKFNIVNSDYVQNGLFLTSLNYKFGIIDYNGKHIIDNEYDNIIPYGHEGFILEKNGSIYYSDLKGNITKIKGKYF